MLFRFVYVALAVVSLVATAQAGPFLSALGNSYPNVTLYNDTSRENLFDLDGNGIDEGDVLAGVVRIESAAEIGGPFSEGFGETVYAIFSQQFASDFTVDPVTGIAQGSFVPTTAAGFTMSDLTGLALDSNAFAAIFEAPGGVSFGSIDTVQGGVTVGSLGLINTPQDLFDTIVNDGILQVSVGFRDLPSGGDVFGNPDTGDFFTFETSRDVADINQLVQGTPIFDGAEVNLGNFEAGLSVLDNPFAVDFEDNVFASTNVGPGGNTLSEFKVTSGEFAASGLPLNGGLFFVNNNADFQARAKTIPEPTSSLVWIGMSVLLAGRRRRRVA